jgi:Putative peptidoglycan binding domain
MRLIRSASLGIVSCTSLVMMASLVIAAVGEAQSPVRAKHATATSQSKKPKPTPERIREVQKALLEAGHDPGPIDGILGPRTKAALRQYASAPPPQALTPAQQIIAQFNRENDRAQSP